MPAGRHRDAPDGRLRWDAWSCLWWSTGAPVVGWGRCHEVAPRMDCGTGSPIGRDAGQNGALPAPGAPSSSAPAPSIPKVTEGRLHVPVVHWCFPPPSLLGTCDTSVSSILQTHRDIVCAAGKKTPFNSIPNAPPWWHHGGVTVLCRSKTPAWVQPPGAAPVGPGRVVPQWCQSRGSAHPDAAAQEGRKEGRKPCAHHPQVCPRSKS